MSAPNWTYEQAIEIVKKAVKESHLDNQRHIDLSVVNAEFRLETQNALAYLQSLVMRGQIEDDQLKRDLGII